MNDVAPPAVESDGRIAGIDLARGLALIGMVAVHLRPGRPANLADWLYSVPQGRASILFVIVAGLGVALLSGRPEVRPAARIRLFWFALVLLPLGLALQALDHGVAVILQHYAAYYLLGLCILGLPRSWLLGLALAWTIAGPLIFLVGRIARIDPFYRQIISITDPIDEIIPSLLISGPYPLITWGAPLLWGVWLGRHDLRDRRLRLLLCCLGAATAIAAVGLSESFTAVLGEPRNTREWRLGLVSTPHSQMPLWLIGSIGSGMALLGACLIAADRYPRLLRPVIALGQCALTLYVAHLFALHFWGGVLRPAALPQTLLVLLVLTVLGSLFALTWRAILPRGPLEMLLHLPSALWERRPASRQSGSTTQAEQMPAEPGPIPPP